ncbi:MAG: nucleotidyltransferase [Clostridiales bacterium]|jgi:predicted nucleotidyltransferase|nr:nucleotidyltransferase [Clostridiales bacterium]
MDFTFITAEYNPFHNGHKRQIEILKQQYPHTDIIIIMSGNFVQRGEPAVFDKYTRTRAALLNGADMVIELPVLYACSSAAYFASGAVRIISAARIGKRLCFGSESGNLDDLKNIADLLTNEPKDYKYSISQALLKGLSYPAARKEAVNSLKQGTAHLLDMPNNILGIEYLKAINKYCPDLECFTVKREGEDYHSKAINSLSSATAIREALLKGEFDLIKSSVPENLADIYGACLKTNSIASYNNLSSIFHYIVNTLSKEELKNILDITEGLENLLIKAIGEYFLISDIIPYLKSKRYTYTKLSRMVAHVLLNIRKSDMDYFENLGGPQYIRVLGFKKDKSYILNELSNKSSLPLINNLKNAEKALSTDGLRMLDMEMGAANMYAIALNKPSEKYQEYRRSLIMLD